MTRAERRHQKSTAKSKTARMLKINKINADEKLVGKATVQHMTCACWMCKAKEQPNYRRYFSDLLKLHGDPE